VESGPRGGGVRDNPARRGVTILAAGRGGSFVPARRVVRQADHGPICVRQADLGPFCGRQAARATTPAAGQNTPMLSIGVSDGTNTAKPGDLLSYTVNIRNLGSASAPPLEVALMLPPAFKLLSASGDGAHAAGQVKWQVSLPASHSAAFRVVGRVGDTPRQLLRLDAVACATAAKGAKPIVCAAASNVLPAGAAAAHGRLAAAPSAHHLIRYVLVAVAAVVLLVLLAGVALMARRRLTTTKHARSSQ